MDQQRRRAIARHGEELTERLWRWDPLNISPPEDEYECLTWPLYRRLTEAAPEPDIVAWLDAELENHFGLDGGGVATDQFVADTIAWFNSLETP